MADDQQIHPPKALRWVAGPLHCRSHEFPSSVQSVVTSKGRLFTILDEAPIGVYEKLPQKCNIIARDAFNGKLLWKVPLRKWDQKYGTGRGNRWNIHHTLPRRLVAKGDRVYAKLQFRDSPISVLDAASGEIITEALEGTKGTDEMLLDGDILIVKTTHRRSPDAESHINPGKLQNSLSAVNVKTARRLWRKKDANLVPYALAAKEGRVVFHNMEELVCLDAQSGRELWRTKNKLNKFRAGKSNLVIHNKTVLFHGNNLTVLSLEDGTELWTLKNIDALSGACVQPTEIFVIGETVWCGVSQDGFGLRTGEVKKHVDLYKLITPGHHQRCMRGKATVNYVIRNKRGAEFVDLDGDNHMRYNWIRSPCFTGATPANGIFYIPPDQCFCYPGVKINGYVAMASDPVKKLTANGSQNLTRGKAYNSDIANLKSRISEADWPMYRHDVERSGSSQTSLPADLTENWRVELPCSATQPVIVGDRLWVVAKDTHTIYCLSTKDGEQIWQYTAGARVDSSPTYYKVMLLLGCRDGSVYCLGAGDGELVWRFRAAPDNRQVLSFGQLESLWPVHGSVAVQDGIVYFAAGRSSFLDGGIIVYALDAKTAKVLHHHVLDGPWPDIKKERGRPFAMEGALSDLIVSDGEDLYMMRIKFDAELNRLPANRESPLGELDMAANHLAATGGFLDDSGFDRLFWMYSHFWPGSYFAQQAPKSGQLVVFNKTTTYAVKYFYRRYLWSPKFFPDEQGCLLFADDNDNQPQFLIKDDKDSMLHWLPEQARKDRHKRGGQGSEKGTGYVRRKPPKWKNMIPVRVRAMVSAGDRLVVAGTPDKVTSDDPLAAFEGRLGGRVMVVSTSDGKVLTRRELNHPPVFDGMSAACGKLFMSLKDGSVVCMGK